MHDSLVLIDGNDNEIVVLDETAVPQKDILHRAFSVFIFNSKGQLLIQQRAEGRLKNLN
jgi:isopentenyl-diphosphate delta-isomerase